MRVVVWFILLSLLGCGERTAPASPETVPGAAGEALVAYQQYCGLCPNAETCCLEESDFAPSQWSPRSGRYLRAMRDYYQCQQLATLGDEPTLPLGPLPNDRLQAFSGSGRVQQKCYPHACMDFAEVMASELDVARAKPEPHAAGALVICAADAKRADASTP